MSFSFIQTPPIVSLAQSPVVFSVSSSAYIAQPNFQYIGLLTIWPQGYNGNTSDTSSVQTYTMTKYPSTQGYTGIFDVGRMVNSTQTNLIQQYSSSVSLFKFDSYYQYTSGSTYISSSLITSSVYQAIDGYQIFPEAIGQPLDTLTPFFPVLLDGPATQSIFIDNLGLGYYFNGNGYNSVTNIIYTDQSGNTGSYTPGASSAQIQTFPIGPAETGFPLSTLGLSSYSIQLYYGDNPAGVPVTYTIDCQQKYPNIRIKWKNRYAGFQYLNMDMINRQSFNSTKKTYQPQIGSWTGTTLSYNGFDSQTINYIVDSTQNIVCNTNWLDESWNDILKQLLVSDEIYWCVGDTEEVIPLTILTSNVTFKTGVVDHLIQYSFEFQRGQNYKLII